MSANTTDNVTLRKSISLVVNSSLFRKIVNGVVTTEYQKMAENINQKVEEILLQISRLSVTVPLDSITQEHLQADSVITDKLADGTVTTNKIASNAVTTDKIADSSITLNKLANNLDITNKITDSSITTEKLVDISVTTSKLAAKSVTTEKIADRAITNDKIASNSITSDSLNSNIIQSSHIANSSVTSRHLANGSVTLPALASDITNVLDSSSSELIQLVNKVTNIENYLMALSSTYTIKDECDRTILFNPDGTMPMMMSMMATATVPGSLPELPPCPPN
jgi:hypothetical protein